MCEYCGCRGVPPFAELMDDHTALVDQANCVRRDLGARKPSAGMSRLECLVADLDRHVRREEDGIFRTLAATGWAIVDDAHARSPGFLIDQATTTSSPV